MSVGVLGSGSFGLAMVNILAQKNEVLLYARRAEVVAEINTAHTLRGIKLSEQVRATHSLEEVCGECELIFPFVPSANFRGLMQSAAPHLSPHHILIHGTKGFDVTYTYQAAENQPKLRRSDVHTMSEVMVQETNVLRVGCLSGPNLSKEILAGQPSGTVLASSFEEVIKRGQAALQTDNFQVYGSPELIGAELAGAMKNTIAIASGMLAGRGLGHNIWALLIARGVSEMVHLGAAMGASPQAFMGVAGIGDLVATASSSLSRNYQVGFRLAKGESLADILGSMTEVAEGVRTTKIIKEVADYYHVHIPIGEAIHGILYHNYSLEKAIQQLMTFPYNRDVDFI